MRCSKCQELLEDATIFCPTCQSFLPNPGAGRRATFFERWIAHILSSMLLFAVITFFEIFTKQIEVQVALVVSYMALMIAFYTRALSPGKYILRLRIIDITTGKHASFRRMLLRELVGKFVSSIVFSMGYLWALIDVNSQTWHDKLARTVVVKEILIVPLPREASPSESSA